MTLTLSPMRFEDIVYEDDWLVKWKGEPVGRILKQREIPQGQPNWYWGINLSPLPAGADWKGHAISLDAAKAAFKTRWERLLQQGGVPANIA